MDVVSSGPLPIASLLWQARPSTWVLTVVCKATFTLAPNESPLALAQEPIREQDAFRDGNAAHSLMEASDLVPFKQSADVVVVGHAHAPGGRPARSLVARIAIGDVDKSIQVFCDRAFAEDGELQEGARFTRMSLSYERAAGGPTNPVGVSQPASVPNLQPPDFVLEKPADTVPAVGFGPVSASWHPNRKEHAAAWSSGALLSASLPESFDRTFFNVAPADQQLSELRGDERIVLENLHPRYPRLTTTLAAVRPRATVSGRAGLPRDISMRCDTLVFDTDRLHCTATWRGQLPLASADEAGEVRIEVDAPNRAPVIQPKKAEFQGTIDISDSGPRSLPFVGRKGPPPAPPPPAPPLPAPPPPPMPPPMMSHATAAGPWTAAPSTPLVEEPRQTVGSRMSASAPPPAVMKPVEPVAMPAAPMAPKDSMTLVWFAQETVPRIVRKPAWRSILDGLEDEPIDPEADDPALSDAPSAIEDRAQVFEVLAHGPTTSVRGVEAALAGAASKRRMPVPPLELVEGELALSFDPIERLKAMVSTATPLSAGDDALSNALASAEKFLGTAGVSSAPAVADTLSQKIRDALGQGKKGRAELVDEQVERALLEERHYLKRKLLGGSHLRGLLHIPGEEHALVTYLNDSVAQDLPLAARFRARMIAAVHPVVDEREAAAVALQAVALGRMVTMR